AIFVEDDPTTTNVDESGGLSNAGGIKFGPDGNLYAVSYANGKILRYQGPNGSSPGAFIDAFISISVPHDLIFGPDGNLYVAAGDGGGGYVNRYNSSTGAPIGNGTFIPTGSSGYQSARQVVFDSLGNYLYVTRFRANGDGEVLRFQGPNGTNPG